MKCALAVLLATLGAARAIRLDAAAKAGRITPMAQVVGLLQELEKKIELEGEAEQKSYDKYACWCEETLGRKANDISSGKETVADTGSLIVKLKAEIASHGAEIAQLKKDIAANVESQREANEVRDKDHEDFSNEKNENEQCTGALEAAIKVLTGAGEKRGFLQALQEAQLMSVVSGVHSVLKTAKAKSIVNDKDLDLIKRFVDHPEDFMGSRAGMVSAAQIAAQAAGPNPFGDYAPQSTQIQGILKGMYDAFAMDLEKDNAEESDSQKGHEGLMETKTAELTTLQETLNKQELEEAQKTKQLADSQSILDDTKAQLAADETFFEETKGTCQVKARDWSNRSRMRTEELMGMGKAIQIMSSDDAKATFESAVTTFVQLGARKSDPRAQAYKSIATLARKYHSLNLAQLAAAVQSGGHFDKVITSIDAMISLLREEEQEDIKHRDRCERSQNKNANAMADKAHEMEKAGKEIGRMQDAAGQLDTQIGELNSAIGATHKDMDSLLEMRNAAVGEFKQAVKDDTDAIALLEQAITSLSAFYANNKLEMSLAQKKETPEYTADADKAPDLSYEGTRTDQGVSGGKSYGGRKDESSGIVAILHMLKEDLEKEVKQGAMDDAEEEAEYEKQRSSLKTTLDSQMQTKIGTEKELIEIDKRINDITTYKDQQGADLSGEKKVEGTIETDCAWVKLHFEKRNEDRKSEMDGLEEAKNFLAGVEELR